MTEIEYRQTTGGDTTTKLVAIARIAMGWMFLWSFVDKVFGLGFNTCRSFQDGSVDRGCDAALINGGSPTFGFLNFGAGDSKTKGLIDWMAPSAPDVINLADVLYILGMFSVGVALTLGIAVRIGAYGGVAMMAMIYLAGSVWPEYNPFLDEHIIFIIVLLIIASVPAIGSTYGLGDKWTSVPAVTDKPFLH